MFNSKTYNILQNLDFHTPLYDKKIKNLSQGIEKSTLCGRIYS